MNLDASFCMDVGQVKTGDDREDTYVKMLQEIVRVTAPIAYGIAAEYPNVVALVKGLKEIGPTALEDLKVSILSIVLEVAIKYADGVGHPEISQQERRAVRRKDRTGS